MSDQNEIIESLVKKEYKYGFYTEVETETVPAGLNEEIIKLISYKSRTGMAFGVAFEGKPPLDYDENSYLG
jgi:hypothetical protein